MGRGPERGARLGAGVGTAYWPGARGLLLYDAARCGASKATLGKMAVWLAPDTAFAGVPLVGWTIRTFFRGHRMAARRQRYDQPARLRSFGLVLTGLVHLSDGPPGALARHAMQSMAKAAGCRGTVVARFRRRTLPLLGQISPGAALAAEIESGEGTLALTAAVRLEAPARLRTLGQAYPPRPRAVGR